MIVPEAAANGPITMATGGASTTSDPFTKDPPASKPVTGVSPTVGGPDTMVTITGSGFAADPAANTVTFGLTRARVTAATATSLTVTVPAAAGSGRTSDLGHDSVNNGPGVNKRP